MKNNFKKVDSCKNCSKCILGEIGELQYQYFCNEDNTFKKEWEKGIKDYKNRNIWLNSHQVFSNTICDDHKICIDKRIGICLA